MFPDSIVTCPDCQQSVDLDNLIAARSQYCPYCECDLENEIHDWSERQHDLEMERESMDWLDYEISAFCQQCGQPFSVCECNKEE